jgi:signal transduction histidine kinase/CheY-like chemotaxis protein/CHASE3 domain sensor protein
MMKRNPVQVKIGFLMLLAVVLLSAIGYYSYQNISSIVASIHVDSEPDLRVLTIREISSDLEKAENSIRIYTITNDSADLRPYLKVLWHINEKVKRLRKDPLNDSLMLQQTDTIASLVRRNINIWQELLALTNSDQLSQDLKHLSDSLNIASANALKPEKGLINKVVNRKYKSPINEVELISNLNKIEQNDRITKEKLMEREAELAVTGSQLRLKFYDIISKMEDEVKAKVNKQAAEANVLAKKTYQLIGLFVLSGTLLSIIVMFIIIRYARRSHAYQLALEKSKDEAENLARTKELFMANMSHEIRTPVTAISGFTEQLLHDNLDEHTSKTLKIIKSSSDHLAEIINDILDFSKLQNEKLVLEKVHFSIGKVLDDTYAMFEKQAQRNRTNLSYSLSPDTPSAIQGDPFRLKQILINLISNAVKFTSDGKVHFSVKTITNRPDDLELVLEVIDTGIGIEENKIDTIFEDFTQAEMSTTRKYGGTGLGLSIVKKLIQLHNGTIEVQSRKNVGTHITCNLHYLPGDANQISADAVRPLEVPDMMHNLKILIVDDEEYNRLLFKTILDRWNIKFSEAINGAEALEFLRNDHFDMVFMDSRMPVMDGLKASSLIREELKIPPEKLPVICISAAALNDGWKKYEDAGMNAFLEKPFTEEMLMTTIREALRYTTPEINESQADTTSGDTASTPLVNLQSLYHLAGDDKQFARQMLVTFLETTTKGLQEIYEAAEKGSWQTVAELAHKLLPPGRHLGAADFITHIKKVEEGVKSNADREYLVAEIQESRQAFASIHEFLNDEIAKIS